MYLHVIVLGCQYPTAYILFSEVREIHLSLSDGEKSDQVLVGDEMM